MKMSHYAVLSSVRYRMKAVLLGMDNPLLATKALFLTQTRLASFCSNIFAVGWLPSDADFIQCYVPDYGLKETRLGRSISIFEASSSLTQYEEIESIARHMDIIVIVMAFSSPAASVLGHNETVRT